jgi:hypothetical protein
MKNNTLSRRLYNCATADQQYNTIRTRLLEVYSGTFVTAPVLAEVTRYA